MQRVRTSFVALVVMLLAGCSAAPAQTGQDAAARATVDAIDFAGLYDVTMTPGVVGEEMGFIRVSWQGDLFGVDNEREPQFAHWNIVQGDTLYSSRNGMAWVRQPLLPGIVAGSLDARLALLNARAMVKDEAALLSMQGSTVHATWNSPAQISASLVVDADGTRLRSVRIESPDGIEAPYTIAPGNTPLRFPLQVPAPVMDTSEVAAGDRASLANHDLLRGLIKSYCQTHAGMVPDTITQDSLRLELLASGRTWPIGAYDGEALRAQESSGHFLWTKTSATQGRYVGMGWDGGIVVHPFGSVQCS